MLLVGTEALLVVGNHLPGIEGLGTKVTQAKDAMELSQALREAGVIGRREEIR
jgi:hypothetical protein